MRVSSDQQSMSIFCLHSLTLALGLLLLLLASCSSAIQPSGYVWTDSSNLVSLSWNNQNGQLSGAWISISYAATAFPASTNPAVSDLEYSGTVTANGAVTLMFHKGPFIEAITGTLSNNGQTLHSTGIDPTTGQREQHVWVAVTADQQTELLTAFNAYMVVQGMLSVVQKDVSSEQDWSDPNRNDVMQARQAVALQAAELATIQQTSNGTTRCQDIGQFAPLPASTFTLLFASSQNGLLRDFATLTHVWNTAQHTLVPQIASLSLPWLLIAQTYQRQSQGANRLVARITTAYTQDEQAMKQLERQEQAITQQVAQLGKACPPTPA